MSIDPRSDARIIDSWIRNAGAWTAAVRECQIESRRLVTDQAVLSTIAAGAPRTLLDIGCGEGWLCRALAPRGIAATGIDAVPALVAEARRCGAGDFKALSYEELAAAPLAARFDVLVCNFSLLGQGSVEGIVRVAPRMLEDGGRFIIQTLHPLVACGAEPYRDGWRAGSWAGFDTDFTDPAPWYFRTIAGWLDLFATHGLQLAEVREPLHPKTLQPASIIFVLTASR